MANKGVFTKILAITGTILIWLPIIAPIIFSVARFIQSGRFLFDYLMPAELGLFVLAGGLLLLWAAFRARSYRKLIGWVLLAMVLILVGGQVIAVVTGLASGEVEPTGWQWGLVLGSIALYILCIIIVGVGGLLLLRSLFQLKPRQEINSQI